MTPVPAATTSSGTRETSAKPQKRPPLTDAQKERIGTLREDLGWSYARIAAAVGAGEGAVSWHCLMQGIESPKGRKVARRPETAGTVLRGGRPVRGFTAADDETLRAMSLEGATKADMCRALGRKSNSVAAALARLAMLDAAIEDGRLEADGSPRRRS